MSDKSKNKFDDDQYKMSRNILIGSFLLGFVLILLMLLVFADTPLEVKQPIVVIVGMVTLIALDAFRRDLDSSGSGKYTYPFTTNIDNRKTVYSGDVIYGNYTTYNNKNLAETAAEIQELLSQLSKEYPTQTEEEQQLIAAKVVEEIEHKPELKSKMIKALQVSGIEALKQEINHPLARVLVASIQGFLSETIDE